MRVPKKKTKTFLNSSLTFREEGSLAGLIGERLDLYVDYMMTRWGGDERNKCLSGYAGEWAGRFRTHDEWDYADSEGRDILRGLVNDENYYNALAEKKEEEPAAPINSTPAKPEHKYKVKITKDEIKFN